MLNRILNKAQKFIDNKYEEYGATDTVVGAQVKLNTIRNKLNIPDEEELVYEEFVQ